MPCKKNSKRKLESLICNCRDAKKQKRENLIYYEDELLEWKSQLNNTKGRARTTEENALLIQFICHHFLQGKLKKWEIYEVFLEVVRTHMKYCEIFGSIIKVQIARNHR